MACRAIRVHAPTWPLSPDPRSARSSRHTAFSTLAWVQVARWVLPLLLARDIDCQRGCRKAGAPMSTVEGQLSAAISNAVVQCTREYTGRGPTKARTTIGNDMIVTRMEDTLTKGERSLADSGKGDMVTDIRRCFQMTMREALID